MPDEDTTGRNRFSKAGIVAILATTALAAIPLAGPWAEIKPSLLIALAMLSAWLTGRWTALLMCGVWAVLERFASVDGPGLIEPITRYGVLVGLILAMSALKAQLEREHRRARLDSLTGLPNRQAFRERCQAELSRAKRFQRPLTIALLDGDRFKAVNDQQGHAAGDQALQATAKALASTIRRYDFAARLGGDEFAVLFPETGAADAEPTALRLHLELTKQVGRTFSPLVYSMGVLTFFAGDWDVDRCLEETDRLLYEAKRAGGGALRLAVAEAAAGDS